MYIYGKSFHLSVIKGYFCICSTMHVNVNMKILFLVTIIIILTIKYTLLHYTVSKLEHLVMSVYNCALHVYACLVDPSHTGTQLSCVML